jgi:hypothetical protein
VALYGGDRDTLAKIAGERIVIRDLSPHGSRRFMDSRAC